MGNSYKEIKELGQGTLGKVYLVQKDNKYYALKKIYIKDINKIDDDSFLNEIKNLSKFNFKYIVKFYEFYIKSDNLNVVMEYAGDLNLQKFIKKYKNNGELIKEKVIIRIINQICLGLKEIHKNNIIHRDLTPKNIFINENNLEIKIGDFDILSKMLKTNKNYAISNVEKFKYSAPEIIKEEENDKKADIYSLGCILYELFTLNEYYTDKYFNKKEIKINIEIYNKKWQDTLDLLLRENPNNRPDIEEICKNFKNEILLTLKIENEDINKKIYFLNNTKEHNNINEINEYNTIIYINNIEYQFNKYFIPKNEGIYEIKIIFYIYMTDCSYMFYDCNKIINIDLSLFNIKYVNNMNYMFYNCINLKFFNFSLNDIENVINKNYMFNYLMKEYDRYGELKYEGEGDYLTNKRNGKGKEYYYYGGLIFEGEYLNGKKHGKCKIYYYDGNLVIEGYYLNDKRNGKFKKYYKNYLIFEGEYLNGKINGKCKIYDLDIKLIFEGEYLNGMRWNGKGKEFIIQSFTHDDENENIQDITCGDTSYRTLVFEGGYLNGKKNGKCKDYYNDGKLMFEGEYLNGKKNGKCKEYYLNGKLSFEGEYLNGKKNGKCKEYSCCGGLEFEGYYLNGEKI